MRRFISAFVVVLAIFTIASPITTATDQQQIIDVEVPCLQIPVTLNGAITGDEWSDAVELPVFFCLYNKTTGEYLGENRSATIYFKHDCVNLWTCIQIEDPVENITVWEDYPSGLPSVFGDCVWIFYDVSGDMQTGAGDDEKGMVHPNFTFDGAIIPEPPGWGQDEDLGGTKDVQGASGWGDEWLTYEMVHPLDSGDSAGNDPALQPGDNILVHFVASDPEFGRMEDVSAWTSYYNLIITPCPVNVGVKAGDWAGYGDVYFEWASNMTGHEEPPPEMNVSWMDMEILDVHDSNVMVRAITIYENGTEWTDVVLGDIATGEGNLSVMIIPSSLGVGDEIPANLTWYTEEPLKLFINGTVTKNYAGADREVNCVDFTYSITYDSIAYETWNISLYWDKKTGVMCEEDVFFTMSYTLPNSTHYYMNMSMLYRMTATNMWPAVFTAHDGYAFNVTMTSNSTISDFNFSEPLKQISFNVTGPTDKAGYCNVTIPKDLLRGEPWTIKVDDTTITDFDEKMNDTHTFLHFTYTHESPLQVTIEGTWVVPEFPSAIILPLLMILTMFAVGFAKKRLYGKQRN